MLMGILGLHVGSVDKGGRSSRALVNPGIWATTTFRMDVLF